MREIITYDSYPLQGVRHSRRACTDLYINLNMMRLMRVYVRTVVTTYVRLFIGCWSDGIYDM